MGRYIDDILQPGEKVLYSTNAHWIKENGAKEGKKDNA